ncbi:LuxR C-terminal-related transcriptional regulator [Alkalinema sp. FACHB-956]|uniref:LuxR C-terminal-related transcriptional regulator n=1 Tax=Alkalinema sp. FACHB-956 TaxID=2692768 RepID=UPI001F54DAF5|nr:LuxR C-terminal-related transcriptional regulator [Alkalinema sp. FACHB-956]
MVLPPHANNSPPRMPTSSDSLLNPAHLLFDLQQATEIAQSFAGCLEPELLAQSLTDGLVERFNCAFARIWLLESNQTLLRLVASSGMYTHTNGFFGRVPMGAYKVGKIAQNRVSFLSNNLPEEPWVGNREWAIAHQIRGFAGYPLAIGQRVIGVLALFSHHPLEPEFLEVLPTLSTLVTVALSTAIQYQTEKHNWQLAVGHSSSEIPLSDQIAKILSGSRLTMLGTERTLDLSTHYLLLKLAETLNQAAYTRLLYDDQGVSLEITVSNPSPAATDLIDGHLAEIQLLASGLGGQLTTQPLSNQRALQIQLTLPYRQQPSDLRLEIACTASVLQLACTQLARAAGLTPCRDRNAPVLTDQPSTIAGDRKIIWIATTPVCPAKIQAKVDLSISPEQLRQVVEAVTQGQTWGIRASELTERELEILTLLTQGHRDRDIAEHLFISESTVKFHLNNVLAKLQVRTRYQAIYQAIQQGWI